MQSNTSLKGHAAAGELAALQDLTNMYTQASIPSDELVATLAHVICNHRASNNEAFVKELDKVKKDPAYLERLQEVEKNTQLKDLEEDAPTVNQYADILGSIVDIALQQGPVENIGHYFLHQLQEKNPQQGALFSLVEPAFAKICNASFPTQNNAEALYRYLSHVELNRNRPAAIDEEGTFHVISLASNVFDEADSALKRTALSYLTQRGHSAANAVFAKIEQSQNTTDEEKRKQQQKAKIQLEHMHKEVKTYLSIPSFDFTAETMRPLVDELKSSEKMHRTLQEQANVLQTQADHLIEENKHLRDVLSEQKKPKEGALSAGRKRKSNVLLHIHSSSDDKQDAEPKRARTSTKNKQTNKNQPPFLELGQQSEHAGVEFGTIDALIYYKQAAEKGEKGGLDAIKRLADTGIVEASYLMGHFLEKGLAGQLKKNTKIAKKYYQQAFPNKRPIEMHVSDFSKPAEEAAFNLLQRMYEKNPNPDHTFIDTLARICDENAKKQSVTPSSQKINELAQRENFISQLTALTEQETFDNHEHSWLLLAAHYNKNGQSNKALDLYQAMLEERTEKSHDYYQTDPSDLINYIVNIHLAASKPDTAARFLLKYVMQNQHTEDYTYRNVDYIFEECCDYSFPQQHNAAQLYRHLSKIDLACFNDDTDEVEEGLFDQFEIKVVQMAGKLLMDPDSDLKRASLTYLVKIQEKIRYTVNMVLDEEQIVATPQQEERFTRQLNEMHQKAQHYLDAPSSHISQQAVLDFYKNRDDLQETTKQLQTTVTTLHQTNNEIAEENRTLKEKQNTPFQNRVFDEKSEKHFHLR